jgi:hypothetical protein
VYRPHPFPSSIPAFPILLCDLRGNSATSALKSFLLVSFALHSCDKKKQYDHEDKIGYHLEGGGAKKISDVI